MRSRAVWTHALIALTKASAASADPADGASSQATLHAGQSSGSEWFASTWPSASAWPRFIGAFRARADLTDLPLPTGTGVADDSGTYRAAAADEVFGCFEQLVTAGAMAPAQIADPGGVGPRIDHTRFPAGAVWAAELVGGKAEQLLQYSLVWSAVKAAATDREGLPDAVPRFLSRSVPGRGFHATSALSA